MKKLFFFIILIILIAVYCKRETSTYTSALEKLFVLESSFEVKKGEIYRDANSRIFIHLDSVVNDSRCPKDAICVWAGNAEVRFVFSVNIDTVNFVLNTHPSFRSDSLIHGYRIKLITLEPYPESVGGIKQDNYKAELKITKE
jgi:hypothetical protein